MQYLKLVVQISTSLSDPDDESDLFVPWEKLNEYVNTALNTRHTNSLSTS